MAPSQVGEKPNCLQPYLGFQIAASQKGHGPQTPVMSSGFLMPTVVDIGKVAHVWTYQILADLVGTYRC